MNAPTVNSLWLRLRIALSHCGPVALAAGVVCVAGLGAVGWLLQASELLKKERDLAHRIAVMPVRAAAPAPVATADQNLALFYASLGDRSTAERQVKTLFGLAEKTGLVLRQGEYKAGYDRNAKLHTYQVTLPVKGSYGAIWQFSLLALRAIPFASLDEISFKRDLIGDDNVEARLRLTMYLADPGAGAQP